MPTPEQEFDADPIGFMSKNIVRPVVGGSSGIKRFKLVEVPEETVRIGSYHKWKKKGKYYRLKPDNNGPLRMYFLGYQSNGAVGTALGRNANDPKYMVTVRMNSCSFGHQQLSANHPAYVSHHNAYRDDNAPNVMENQAIDWGDHGGANPNLSFSHRGDYMTDSKGNLNFNYQATTFGVRDANGKWHFYYQASKYHNGKDKDLSLKGVKQIV